MTFLKSAGTSKVLALNGAPSIEYNSDVTRIGTTMPDIPAGAGGEVVPIRVTSELYSIDGAPLSASTFEVPADFKKVTSGK